MDSAVGYWHISGGGDGNMSAQIMSCRKTVGRLWQRPRLRQKWRPRGITMFCTWKWRALVVYPGQYNGVQLLVQQRCQQGFRNSSGRCLQKILRRWHQCRLCCKQILRSSKFSIEREGGWFPTCMLVALQLGVNWYFPCNQGFGVQLQGCKQQWHDMTTVQGVVNNGQWCDRTVVQKTGVEPVVTV